jgi:acetyl-CoA carboxylase beta subunit
LERGEKLMEECPECRSWTYYYDPQSENKICLTCGHKEQVKYDAYIKESNVINFLRYPCPKTEEIVKTVKV